MKREIISVRAQVLLWFALLVFWTVFSTSYHPTILIDISATTLLLTFYAAIVYINYLVLLPRLRNGGKYFFYWSALLLSMIMLTFIVHALIRILYSLQGDADQLGDYWQHYAIDLFGMAVHLLLAAAVVWIGKRRKNSVANSVNK